MKKQIIDISYNSKENTKGLEKRLSNLYPYKFAMDVNHRKVLYNL